ncbi:shikimate dehydrogenase [Ochrobactrum sp. Marseille-Q0166]|uniref:shikimate dehydrogenase family protein n=1 Tax=Ochrobactrum sp. Marseille-Q0166 TaxID=2761105 RepID=UPI0016553E76|nr:shikimate dehydrogenase [Ochrobactrum sp. Marseille-Q0166]MBC8718674.1 shikimate dehydrogenase [Ochrobactrum sp. Marseille-Q0166]
MNNSFHLDGATRIYPIIGDPIAQVKSPAGMTNAFAERGHNAMVVPAQISVDHVDDYIQTCGRTKNVDGIIATIPHKFAALEHCSTATERARICGSINVLRRNADGTWHGDNFDGLGMVAALRAQGAEPTGQKTLLVGAGGAGIAIAQALLEAGVSELAVHDADMVRRDHLVARMREFYGERVRAGSDNPAGCGLVVNATPMGMRPEHPFPVQVEHLSPDTFVGCAITSPAVSPWVAVARAKGCKGCVGIDMYKAVQQMMIEFFLETIHA